MSQFVWMIHCTNTFYSCCFRFFLFFVCCLFVCLFIFIHARVRVLAWYFFFSTLRFFVHTSTACGEKEASSNAVLFNCCPLNTQKRKQQHFQANGICVSYYIHTHLTILHVPHLHPKTCVYVFSFFFYLFFFGCVELRVKLLYDVWAVPIFAKRNLSLCSGLSGEYDENGGCFVQELQFHWQRETKTRRKLNIAGVKANRRWTRHTKREKRVEEKMEGPKFRHCFFFKFSTDGSRWMCNSSVLIHFPRIYCIACVWQRE